MSPTLAKNLGAITLLLGALAFLVVRVDGARRKPGHSAAAPEAVMEMSSAAGMEEAMGREGATAGGGSGDGAHRSRGHGEANQRSGDAETMAASTAAGEMNPFLQPLEAMDGATSRDAYVQIVPGDNTDRGESDESFEGEDEDAALFEGEDEEDADLLEDVADSSSTATLNDRGAGPGDPRETGGAGVREGARDARSESKRRTRENERLRGPRPRFVLTGIRIGKVRQAVINNRTLQVGEALDGFRVTSIQQHEVEMRSEDGNTVRLDIRE